MKGKSLMKSEKGITLMSLTIYVIAMLITVTIMTVLTSYFYQNISVDTDEYTYLAEFTRFDTYMVEESNKSSNSVLEISPENTNEQKTAKQVYIALSSGNQYTFIKANKAIYQNNVKIASGVEEMEISESIKNGKTVITMKIKIKDKTRSMQFVLQN